jgi:prepilin-type N-terminal cleavage/methylation domain-containing protein
MLKEKLKERLKISYSDNGGFTLIEMLIVIAVIAILAGIVITGITGFQASARDTKRIANLRSAQNLLELYYNSCGRYPGGLNCEADDVDGGAGSWADLTDAIKGKLKITNFPEPPGGLSSPTGNKRFLYQSDGGTSYVLGAELEGDNSALRENFTAPSYSDIDCSNGGTGDAGTDQIFCITSD